MFQLVTTTQAARMLGLKTQTLRVWRLKGKGPKYTRLGGIQGRCHYKIEDIEKWLSERTFCSTSEETVSRK